MGQTKTFHGVVQKKQGVSYTMNGASHSRSPGQRLRFERERLHWSQERLAEALKTTARSINRWENDKVLPQAHYREQLCHLFGVAADVLFASSHEEASTSAIPLRYHLPHHRNPLFTGREHVLAQLAALLHKSVSSSPVALSGVAGMGKTQTALEYAYRFAERYETMVWLRAETSELLHAHLASLAPLLSLPETDAADHAHLFQAMQHWLHQHDDWLLILDNVEALSLLQALLPTIYHGHVLLTTRTPVTGVQARMLSLENMEPSEGTLLLLRRAKYLAPDSPMETVAERLRTDAFALAQLLDGLPLALDQAGAYIEETGCSPADYLDRYQTHRASLLNRRGTGAVDHPASVMTTLSLCMKQVEREHPAAAEVLRLCTFLHPDAIPEEVLTEVMTSLPSERHTQISDPVSWDELVGCLRHSSLVRRHAESKTLTIHRLVQTVLKLEMDETTQRHWATTAVQLLNTVFPEGEDPANWSRCQRYLAHALVGVQHIEEWHIVSAQAGRLLTQLGIYLRERAVYTQAEHLLCLARDIRMQVCGSEHLEVAETLEALAWLYADQGKQNQAEEVLRHVLTLREHALGLVHPLIAVNLNNLALRARALGRFADAITLLQRALAIWEHLQETTDLARIASLNNLALLYQHQGQYTLAEPLLREALRLYEQQEGSDALRTAYSLNNLGALYRDQHRYEEAEPLLQRALAIRAAQAGEEHPDTAFSMHALARLYLYQEKYTQAELLYQQVLKIRERVGGLNHPDTATTIHDIGVLYQRVQRDAEAEECYLRALTIREHYVGPEHPATAKSLHDLATLYDAQGRDEEAESLYRRALTIREQKLGKTHGETQTTMQCYEEFLQTREQTRADSPLLQKEEQVASER